MQFNHDNMTGSLLAAQLATLHGRGWSTAGATEVLRDFSVRRSELDDAASGQLESWAATLRVVFSAPNEISRCEAINTLLDAATARIYLTMHDNLKPHLHFTSDDDDIVARVKAVTAGGLAIFTLESEGGRLGACQREGCPEVFVDTSRNGRRAYCTTRCGNHVAVRRHRGKT